MCRMKLLPFYVLVLVWTVMYTSISVDASVLLPVCKPGECSYNGKCYQDGKKFKAGDGCNDCWCYQGSVASTKILCRQDRCPGGNMDWWRPYCNQDSDCSKGYYCHKGSCCPNPYCPRLDPRIMVKCVWPPPDQCDDNCLHCCPWYCGLRCLTSLPEQGVHNLVCPTVAAGTGGMCYEGCTSDADCKHPLQKCCSNGCGHVCMAAERNEPPRGKTNNVVSEQVRQKPACTRKYHNKCPEITVDPTGPCDDTQFLCPEDGCADDLNGPRVCCRTRCGDECMSMTQLTGPN